MLRQINKLTAGLLQPAVVQPAVIAEPDNGFVGCVWQERCAFHVPTNSRAGVTGREH